LPAPPLAMTGISSALKIRVKFNSNFTYIFALFHHERRIFDLFCADVL